MSRKQSKGELYFIEGNMNNDYHNKVERIKFFVDDFIERRTYITLNKNDNSGASVTIEKVVADPFAEQFNISISEWDNIINTLYGEICLHEWKKRYVNHNVLDGTQWRLEIELTDKQTFSYYGSNDFPPYWNELLKLFGKLDKSIIRYGGNKKG